MDLKNTKCFNMFVNTGNRAPREERGRSRKRDATTASVSGSTDWKRWHFTLKRCVLKLFYKVELHAAFAPLHVSKTGAISNFRHSLPYRFSQLLSQLFAPASGFGGFGKA